MGGPGQTILRPETASESSLQSNTLLAAAQAFAAIQTFVASAITHGNVSAVRTGRRVLLKMRNRIAECLDCAHQARRGLGMGVTVGRSGLDIDQIRVF